jgi:hypothetical protein
MSTRKPRADASLKTLPEERQAEIIEYMRSHKYADTRAWLSEQGITASAGALSGFWSWWHVEIRLKHQLKEAATIAEELKSVLGTMPQLNLNEEQLNLVAQTAFEVDAVKREDFEQFVALRQLRQKDRRLALDKEEHGLSLQKFQRDTAELFIKWAEDQRAKDVLASSSSNAEKIEQLGSLMFGEDWKT